MSTVFLKNVRRVGRFRKKAVREILGGVGEGKIPFAGRLLKWLAFFGFPPPVYGCHFHCHSHLGCDLGRHSFVGVWLLGVVCILHPRLCYCPHLPLRSRSPGSLVHIRCSSPPSYCCVLGMTSDCCPSCGQHLLRRPETSLDLIYSQNGL